MTGRKIGAHVASAERNVLLVGFVRALAVSGAVVVPNLPQFLSAYGQSIWTIESCFALAMLLAMVPSGHLADRVGDKRVLQIGALLLSCGSMTYVFAGSGKYFYLAEILLGLGHGFILGSDESLLFRSLAARGEVSKFSCYWTKIVAGEVLVCSVYLLAGEWLASIGERLPMMFSSACYLLLVVVVGLIREPAAQSNGASGRSKLGVSELWTAVYLSFSTVEIRASILWCAFLMSVLRVMFWSYSEYLRVSGALASIGVVLAIGSIVTAAGSFFAKRVTESISLERATRASLLVVGASLIVLGTVVGPWSFLLVFVHYAVRGIGRVFFAQSLHHAVSTASPEIRATVASIREMSFLVCYLVLLNCARLVSGHSGTPSMMLISGFLLLGLLLFVGKQGSRLIDQG